MTTRAAGILATVALALSACTHDGAATTTPGGQPKPRTTSPAIAELLAGVPGTAVALGFLDVDTSPWSLITEGTPLPLDEATRKSLDKELRAHIDRYLGLDVSRLQYAVGFFAASPPRGAVLLKTISGALKMPGASDHEGGKVWIVDPDEHVSVAIRGDVIALGSDAAVREVLETLAGKRTPVTTDNRALVDWLRKDSSGAFLAFAATRPTELRLPPPVGGLERFAVTLNASGIAAVVDGDDASISWLQATSDQAFATMLATIEQAHAAALAGETKPAEGAMAIIGSAYARSYAARLKPRRSGNRLVTSLDLGLAGTGPVAVVAVMGMLSAAAIPAFMDYTKRSKKTEAALMLDKIGKSAKRVYAESGRYPTGSAPVTPQQPCCGQPKNHCAAAPALFASSPVWASLDFQIDEPTLFQYSYRASPDGQRFVAQAVGDLDCDGVFITYELTGTASGGAPTLTLTEPRPNSD